MSVVTTPAVRGPAAHGTHSAECGGDRVGALWKLGNEHCWISDCTERRREVFGSLAERPVMCQSKAHWIKDVFSKAFLCAADIPLTPCRALQAWGDVGVP